MTPTSRLAARITGSIGAVGVAALVVSGCSVTGVGTTSGAEGDGTGTINALFMKQAGYSEENVNQMIADFEAENPDIDVQPTFVAYEALHDKIVTSAPAGTYDVVAVDVIWPAEFASKGLVVDVTEKFPESWESEMLGGALTSAEYDGRYWGVPWGPSTKLFFSNEDMLAQVGLTADDVTSWEGVLDAARAIKAAGIVEYPLSWSWAQAEALICDYAVLLGAFGGDFTDDDGNLAVNSEAGVAALEWMKATLDEGLTDPASLTFLEDDVNKSMASGSTAMALNWESTFRDLNDESISTVVGSVAVAAPPTGPEGDRPGVNGSMALSIPSQSKNQAAAWSFITFVSSREVQEQYVTSSPTNWKASYEDDAITQVNPEVFAAAATAYDSLILRPTVPEYNSVSQILQLEIQNALLGNKSAQQAMDDAVAAAAG